MCFFQFSVYCDLASTGLLLVVQKMASHQSDCTLISLVRMSCSPTCRGWVAVNSKNTQFLMNTLYKGNKGGKAFFRSSGRSPKDWDLKLAISKVFSSMKQITKNKCYDRMMHGSETSRPFRKIWQKLWQTDQPKDGETGS